MKKQMTSILALLCSFSVFAQSADRQVIGSSGGSYSSSGLQADYTLGEVVTITGAAGTFVVHQGFQQNPANTTNIMDKDLLVSFGLYPNPTNGNLTLRLNAANPFMLRIVLSNVAGQIFFADQNAVPIQQSFERDFSVQNLATGVYFLNLYNDENKLLKSIQFVKQ